MKKKYIKLQDTQQKKSLIINDSSKKKSRKTTSLSFSFLLLIPIFTSTSLMIYVYELFWSVYQQYNDTTTNGLRIMKQRKNKLILHLFRSPPAQLCSIAFHVSIYDPKTARCLCDSFTIEQKKKNTIRQKRVSQVKAQMEWKILIW